VRKSLDHLKQIGLKLLAGSEKTREPVTRARRGSILYASTLGWECISPSSAMTSQDLRSFRRHPRFIISMCRASNKASSPRFRTPPVGRLCRYCLNSGIVHSACHILGLVSVGKECSERGGMRSDY